MYERRQQQPEEDIRIASILNGLSSCRALMTESIELSVYAARAWGGQGSRRGQALV